MVDAGVQIPLDALAQDVGKPGNPPAWGAGERRFKSGHPDCDCPVAQMVVRLVVTQMAVGSSPTGTARFGGASRPATATAWKAVEAKALAGSTPVPSARSAIVLWSHVPVAQRNQQHHASNVGVAGSNPAGDTSAAVLLSTDRRVIISLRSRGRGAVWLRLRRFGSQTGRSWP